MQTFDLSFNEIKKIQNLEQMTSLNYLNVGFNFISSISDVFRSIGYVTTLILRNNQLSCLKVEDLQIIESVEKKETETETEVERSNFVNHI